MSTNNQAVCVSVKGQVVSPGEYQINTDDSILTVVFQHAGGMAQSRFLLKAVLVGGTLGHFASQEELRSPIAENLGIMVFDEGSCLVNVTRLLLAYNATCLQKDMGCPTCRQALPQAVDILERLSNGQGTPQDLEELCQISTARYSECPNHCSSLQPIASAMTLWKEEFAAHNRKRCPAGICNELMVSPCTNSCPAGVNLPGTIALMQMGRYVDALALGRDANPFFLTCGFVCEEPPCQKNCKRWSFDEPVYSQSLHRYAGEAATQQAGGLVKALQHPAIRAGIPTGKKVAIIGAGPAGLSAAYFLARLGHQAVVYEKLAMAGGMPSFGIPSYRLPRDILAKEIGAILDLGVSIITEQALGCEVTLEKLQSEYDAVLLTIGADKSRMIGVEGEDLPGIMGALEFLQGVSVGTITDIGTRVLVVGGGNVAVDAARTARRLGQPKVTMMCVEDRFEMPGSKDELAAAKAEGIKLAVLSVPVAFCGSEHVETVRYATVQPGPYDVIGRRWPPAIQEQTLTEEAFDKVIVAIGQMPDSTCLPQGTVITKGPYIVTDQEYATDMTGVFSAGDCSLPGNSVVKAVKSGKEAAQAIDKYLTGETHELQSGLRHQIGCFSGDYSCQIQPRVTMPEQTVSERVSNFAVVATGLGDQQAAYEMRRCICAAKGSIQR